jgi:hypothetical protein
MSKTILLVEFAVKAVIMLPIGTTPFLMGMVRHHFTNVLLYQKLILQPPLREIAGDMFKWLKKNSLLRNELSPTLITQSAEQYHLLSVTSPAVNEDLKLKAISLSVPS